MLVKVNRRIWPKKVASLSESTSIKGINSLFNRILCLNQVPSCCRGPQSPLDTFLLTAILLRDAYFLMKHYL